MSSWIGLEYNTPQHIRERVEDVAYGNIFEPSEVFKAMSVIRTYGKEEGQPYCGTTLCMAGWTAFLNPKAVLEECDGISRWQELGQEILGLNYETARRLFHQDRWPIAVRHEIMLKDHKLRSDKAKQAFAAKKGAELVRAIAAGKDPWTLDKKASSKSKGYTDDDEEEEDYSETGW